MLTPEKEYATLCKVETLGYGAYLIIDGLKADKHLNDADYIGSFLTEISKTLEPSFKAKLEVYASPDGDSGVSALAVLGESHASLHTFGSHKALSLRIFSRYNVLPEVFSDALKSSFGVRRLSSHLSNHSKTVAAEADRRKKTLFGDRQYTSLRLDKNLMF